MSKSRKSRKSTVLETKDVEQHIAAVEAARASLDVGKTYHDKVGNSYEVLAILDETVTVRRGDSRNKIPFSRNVFEGLVGLHDATVTATNAAAAEAKAAADKQAAEEAATAKAAAEAAAAQEREKVKEARKAVPARGNRGVSGMWVIRTCMAKNLKSTVAEISAACKAAGVPKCDATIKTIMSDFMQSYNALVDAGVIAKS